MNDQAKKLREIIHNIKKQNKEAHSPTFSKNTADTDSTRVITITSGKGGVGKSNFTINLGLSLNKLGYKVTILDADLGLANIDIILGVIPKYSLAHVIRKEKSLEEIMVEGPGGIKLISGGSGLKELANLTEEQITNLIVNLKLLGKSTDFILIDTGAGINNSVLSFVDAASEIILVTTPEPTSITDAYAVLKNIVLNDKEKIIRVLINRVENNEEGLEVFNKLNTASQRFLNVSLQRLGYLYDDILVSRAVKRQTPFLLVYPNSLVSKGVETIASRLVNETNSEVFEVSGLKKFIHKFFYSHRESL
ncbi:MinD/ParA family protein [Marinisporobacter balticus]|uniref:Flagellar biosynthesis protein FlhG n=1 Tax=Marinisporobacter balticus TaxID=2018667 RepID=A0A4R2LAY8_9FIRM|nr:MinD/ParA family protein [Marinisporobacter balticus]TCO79928.1 flagellar biosynthesis protein FlhG [Marinisporobacter balticus]